MKIRHKQSGVVLEGQFSECANWGGLPPERFFHSLADGSRYNKRAWEEVKPEWVDVTGECEADGTMFVHRGIWCGPGANGYRIRKVEAVMSGYPHPQYFIVEKRQS